MKFHTVVLWINSLLFDSGKFLQQLITFVINLDLNGALKNVRTSSEI